LKLHTTAGGSISHALAAEHRGMHMAAIGDNVTLTAVPEPGYRFVEWRGSMNTTNNPLVATMPDSHGVIWAVFAEDGQPAPEVELYTMQRHWDAFEAIEATYVDEALPDSNFAGVAYPKVRPVKPSDGAVAKHAFLKFDVDRVPVDPGSIAYATVKYQRLQETSLKDHINISSTDTSWSKDSITWNTKPALPAEPISYKDYSVYNPVRHHLEVTDYFQAHGTGVHSFCVSGTRVGSAQGDFEMVSSDIPDSINTEDKPLLYIVWDEKVPIEPWDTSDLPQQAIYPAPADGSVNQPAELDLSWASAFNTTSYNVYFGTTSNLVLQGSQAVTSFDPDTLTYAAGYDWRIDAINASGTTTGAIWSFTVNPGLNDSDGDGMIDLHEQLAGTDPHDPASALKMQIDLIDLHEQLAGTDPHDPASALKMQIDFAALPSPLIKWSSVSNRHYRVFKGTNLTAGTWSELTNGIIANPPENELILPTDDDQAFFRIELDD